MDHSNIRRDLLLPALRSARRFLTVGREKDIKVAREHLSIVVKNIFDAPLLGIDLDGTIDEGSEFFGILTHLWPAEVFIITYRDDAKLAHQYAQKFGIHYDHLILVQSLSDKARVITENNIKVYIDDMDECLMDIPSDVIVLKMRNPGNFEDGKWLYSDKTGKKI